MSQAGKLNSGSGILTVPVTVPNGGTGQITLPAHTVLIGEGTSAIGNAGPGASNSILMGQGPGADPIFGTLVAGSNITLTNGAGTITISSTGGGSTGNITFTDDAGSTAITSAGAINLFGDSASGSSVLGNGAQTITVANLTATTAQKGVILIATNAQAIAGSDTFAAVTSDDLKAKLGAQTLDGIAFGQGQSAALGWTALGAANTVLQGTGGSPIFATVPNAALANSSVTLNSGNNITVTGGGPLSLGGVASFNVTGTTNHAVLLGNATGSITSAALGTNGQVLIGSTGADPQFGTITSGDGSITVTTGAGTLALSVTGGTTTGKTITGDTGGALPPTAGNWNILGTAAQGLSFAGAGSTLTGTVASATTVQKGVLALASNAEAIAGADTAKAVTSDDLRAKLGAQTVNGIAFGNGTTNALNWTSAGNNGVLITGATGTPTFLAGGTTGQVLIATTGSPPTWGANPSSAGTITGDSGGALSQTANNWNILGQKAGTIPVMDTIGSVSTLSVEDRTWVSPFVVDPSSTVGLRGTYTTISSAIADAVSGQDIYIRPGTYTENITLKAGVNLTASGSDSSLYQGSGNVLIIGKLTFTGSGTVSLFGLTLQTNSDFCLAVTGVSASIVNLNNCTIRATNNTAISFTSSNASSNINVWYSTLIQTADNIAYFASSSTGLLYFFFCHMQWTSTFTNSKSTASSGSLVVDFCVANVAITTSAGAVMNVTHGYFDSGNQVTFTVGGSSANIRHSNINSGTAIAVTANATTNINDCVINSSNGTAAISGSSTVNVNSTLFGTTAKITATRAASGQFVGAAHGVTGGIGNGATASIFTANTQSMYMVSCQGNGAANVRACAFVSYDGAGNISSNDVSANGCNIAVSGSTISIHNTAGGSITFNWSVLKLY